MSKQSILFSKSWQLYKNAESTLKENCRKEPNAQNYLFLAQHQSMMQQFLTEQEWKTVEQNYLQAIKLNDQVAEPYNELGLLYQAQNLTKKAIDYFEAAFIRQPQNLTYRNNLAHALLLDKQYEQSETAYNKLIAMAPAHVEAHIGLGSLYTALADEENEEYYETAIRSYSKALQLSRSGLGSKKLSAKEEAGIYYLRGYAMVKINETAPVIQKSRNIYKALEDFKNACRLDPDMQSSKRAKDAIRKKLQRNIPVQIVEKLGPLTIVIMSIVLFIYVQHDFWGNSAHRLESTGYISLSFGSLLFLIAGLTLPQLLKLKVAGIELEKNAVDASASQNIFTAGSLGLKLSERSLQGNIAGTLRW